MTDPSPSTGERAAASPGPHWLSPRLTRWAAFVLGGVAACATVAILAQLVLVRPDVQAARADTDDRAEAARAAERFAVQVNNFEAADVDSLKQSLTPLLTTKFNTDFEKTVDGLLAQIDEADLTSKGEVIRSAVADADADSATVLVVADATADSVFGPRVRHFRWSVDLVEVDGRWLVDDFTPVQ